KRSWGRRWPASAAPRQLGFDSAGEAFDDRAGDAPGDARPCIAASAAVAVVDVHRLQAEPPRSEEAIEDELARAGEDTRAETHDLDLHPDRRVLIEPAARLDVDGFVGTERDLEDVPVALQEHHSFVLLGGEAIDETCRRCCLKRPGTGARGPR